MSRNTKYVVKSNDRFYILFDKIPNNINVPNTIQTINDITYTDVLETKTINDITFCMANRNQLFCHDDETYTVDYFETYISSLGYGLTIPDSNIIHPYGYLEYITSGTLKDKINMFIEYIHVISNNQTPNWLTFDIQYNDPKTNTNKMIGWKGLQNYIDQLDLIFEEYPTIINSYIRYMYKNTVIGNFTSSQLPERIRLGHRYLLENYIGKDLVHTNFLCKVLAWNCKSAEYGTLGMISEKTKTYTNSTWSTSKTWYIKTIFKPNTTAVNGSNVVNYDTIYVTKVYITYYTITY